MIVKPGTLVQRAVGFEIDKNSNKIISDIIQFPYWSTTRRKVKKDLKKNGCVSVKFSWIKS